MREVSKEQWIANLKEGDLVIVRGKTLFGKLQALDAKMDGNKEDFASHSAMIYQHPDGSLRLFEADGLKGVIVRYGVDRYFSDHHQMWVWRFDNPTEEQLEDLHEYMEDITTAGVNYSWGGIRQFIKKAWRAIRRKKYTPKEVRGMFCSEATSRAILRANFNYIIGEAPETISPSRQRQFMECFGAAFGWSNPLAYDCGRFLAA